MKNKIKNRKRRGGNEKDREETKKRTKENRRSRFEEAITRN